MALGLVGKKCGMSRKFLDDGTSVPITLVEVLPNRITQLKTLDNDGYVAVQVSTGEQLASRVNKPKSGHFAKAKTGIGRGLWEFRVAHDSKINGEPLENVTLGTEIKLDLFSVGQKIDVAGVSVGKGFAGVVKRHNFAMQDATHGNSLSHRAPGSIGQNQTPGKVFKGKKMAGRMGNVNTTVQNLEVVDVIQDQNIIMVKGAIPGSISGTVIIKPAVKSNGIK